MRRFTIQWGIAGLVLLSIAGCGGGSSESVVAPPAVSSPVVKAAIDSASAVATNDTATNSSASFSVLQDAGLPAVTVNIPPVVNFAVFSDGKVKTGLTINDVRFAIAKLVPGTNGDPDQWVSYINTTKTANVGPGNALSPKATAMQATTDSKLSLEANEKLGDAGQFVYNSDGYYTYTFKTDITQASKTGGVVYDPLLTHRVAIQLSYKNAAGETILVNPYFDFTVVNGKSVPVTDPAKTRKMTDVASCNGCHEKLGLHGGGRVDTQYCVMCHNPGTTDPDSGNNLNLATMVHKIHAGKRLAAAGENYTIWGYKDGEHAYKDVGFPQDLRNCTVCHSGANPKTPQGDNWKTKPSKEACLTCHASGTGSKWDGYHRSIADQLVGVGQPTKSLKNESCAACHSAGADVAPERVHWNQNEENGAKYKMNIESATYDDAARKVMVTYFLSDPTNANAAYDLTSNATKFGKLRLYLAYQNMVGQSTGVTEFSAYNNGGGLNVDATKGKPVPGSSNRYTQELVLPTDTDTAKAFGTARVVTIGQIVEPKLNVQTRVAITGSTVNTVVQHTFADVALSGALQPRRVIVSNEKCNVCHGALGTTTGSNTTDETLHSGARNTVEACVVCHDANRASSTIMTNGLAYNESYQFKRMIHGIHGNSKRTYPFTHGNKVAGTFGKDGVLKTVGTQALTSSSRTGREVFAPNGTLFEPWLTSTSYPIGTELVTGPSVVNYAAEVAWPGVGINCNACHVNNSYKQDFGTLGSVISKPIDASTKLANSDPSTWRVISPKAATCTACHDSPWTQGHVREYGGSSFGDRTQKEIAGLPSETCFNACHASGSKYLSSKTGNYIAVDLAHGQK